MKKIIVLLMAVMFMVSLTACRASGDFYDIGNADRASYFTDQYNKLVEQYGEASFDGDKLQGVAVARLLDFTGDGIYEIYIAYADGTKDYVNRHKVIGFNNGPATILDEEIVSKANATDKTPEIWLYTDDIQKGYVVKGEAMNEVAEYTTFITTIGEEKIYEFRTEFTVGGASADEVELDGTYEKIALAGITQEDADLIFEENQNVIESIENQSK